MYDLIHPGTYGLAGSEQTWERSVLAAVLSTTAPSAASHRTAARIWGLTTSVPPNVEVVSARHQRVKRQSFVVHESKDLVPADIVEVDGIPVTTAVRTVVDLGASAPPPFVARCVDSGIRQDLFNAWDVRCFIARVARPGRTGIGTIRPIVTDRLRWSGQTESELEDLFRRLIGETAIPMPESQIVVDDDSGRFVGRFDFGYRDTRVLIELDSKRWHLDPDVFERDREKQNRALALGWTVYRFTWKQITTSPESILGTLASISAP
ncbi:MAG: hypothetical protein ACR2N7_01585 [Acidimicrobiia bacterium]